MVHPLLATTHIQIKDTKGPNRQTISAKKSFKIVRQILGADSNTEGGQVFIILDRYRFEVV